MTSTTDLEIFSKVARLGNMSAAAREMGLSPAVISKRVSLLEARLGAKLFQRTTRQLTLTDIGLGFQRRVVEILNLVEEAEEFVGRENRSPSGLLRMTLQSSFARRHIVPHLDEFRRHYPEIELDFDINDDPVDIIRDGYDIAVRFGEVKESSLSTRPLLRMKRNVFASVSYIQRHGVPVRPQDLKNHGCLILGNDDTWQLEDTAGRRYSVKVSGPMRCNSSLIVQEALREGLGIALQSQWELPEEAEAGPPFTERPRAAFGAAPPAASGTDGRRRLVRIMNTYRESRDGSVYALFAAREYVPAKITAFVDFFADRLAHHHGHAGNGAGPVGEYALHAKAAD